MRSLICILFFLFTISSYAQETYTDTIYLSDGSILNAKVLKQKLGKYITYKTKSGSITTIRWEDIKKYHTDHKLIITENYSPISIKKKSYLEKGYNEYLAFGLGFGNAYGGLGAQLQIRGGKTIGFGAHFGAGYIPKAQNKYGNTLGWKIGAKLYYYKYLYLNATYGVVALYKGGQTGIGPSVLIGGDFIFTKHIGLNVAVGVSKYNEDLGSTYDIGILIKLPSPKKKSETQEIN